MNDNSRKDFQQAGFVSIVIPVYNNAETLLELYAALTHHLCGHLFEVLFVDDASPDDSFLILQDLASRDSRVRFIHLVKNVGQNRAIWQGFAACKGDKIVVMDADLQDPPAAVLGLLAELDRGWDVVFAGRRGNYESGFRLFTSRVFKWLIHKTAAVPQDAGLFMALRRNVLKSIPRSSYLVGMIGFSHARMCSIPVIRNRRERGVSAYSFWKRLRLGLRAVGAILWIRARKIKLD
ncbi:MAG: glycosyltransferase family 2 protein [Verrucomicrobia bacterium]|nr:glycosyltransferase family 2 protein [Verrucomicrobiota bacterium]MBU6446606.1 glycosyltransferase family 2 protein [Verrucomicrobiota bacterium]MDE3047128.1 glycosyltransferase family 2 protein [Verrucomicrobiota bacterium]